ncbi:MAG: DUF4382 domain-containing protein [Nitrososphaerota archaeon]|nr:DUF4382 domain-containing protein [Nitrososphaerota archaeon]MDG6924057.1 DUF4382 domain-containing protein [Nitrososphaerota archaeon]
MSSKSSIFMSGAVAAIIAIVLISGVLAAGILNSKSTNVTESQVSQTSSGSGTLAVLLTDPPTIPNGTTHVYVTYDGLAVHVSGAANNSGWHVLSAQGSIDLMSIINVSQTIAAANIQSGRFDALAFNITSAVVTFIGKNYSAYLVYQEHKLIVPVVGGITITNAETSAAIIDLTPTVLLLGDPSSPAFAFIPAARGYTIPAQSVPQAKLQHVGQNQSINNQTWYQNNRPRFEITGVVLEPNSLSITVANTGNISLDFTLAAVTSLTSLGGGSRPTLPSVATISEFFVVYPNTSLVPLIRSDHDSITSTISGGGYMLPPHASVTFKYTGLIKIGVVSGVTNLPVHYISPGSSYVISIASSDRLAQIKVAATGSG